MIMDGTAVDPEDIGCGWIVDSHQLDLERRSKSKSETSDAEEGLTLGASKWRNRRNAVLNLVRRERQQKWLQATTTIVCIGDEDPADEITAVNDVGDDDGPNVLSFRTITDLLLHNHAASNNVSDPLQTKFNDRTSLLSTDDEVAVIQLCLAERNRKKNGVFDANFDDVLTAKDLITRIRLKRFVDDQKLEPARADQEPCRQLAALMNAMFESPDISKDDVNNQRDDQLVIDYETYLGRCNVVDTVQLLSLMPASKHAFVLAKSDLIVLQVPVDGIQKMMLALLLADKPTFKVLSTTVALDNESASNPQASSADIELKAEKCVLREFLLSQEAGGSNRHDGDEMSVAAQLHVEKIVVAYLRLLLNTRDEIALTIALGSMTNGFSHQAFTALRKLSASTGSLSMFQTALSFVLKVRLGGLSYAPDSSCPIMQYLPELSTFTTVMNKLQTALEEATNSLNAFKKIFTVLKFHLTKTCNAKLKQDSLQKALQNIELCAHRAIKNAQRLSLMCNASTGAVQQEYILELRHLVSLHATEISLWNSSSKVWTLDTFSSQNSPIRFPSLLSQFKSPLSDDITPTKPPKDESGKLREKTKSLAPSIRSEVITSDSCKLSPRPNLVQAVRIATPNTDDNKENSSPIRKQTSMAKKPTKRCLINDVLCPATMSTSKRSKGSVKSKPVKKTSKPVPKGQQLMTRFLRA